MPDFVALITFVKNLMMQLQQTKLTEAQIEFLSLFNRDVSDADLIELKRLVARYFADKAIAEIDKVWEKEGYDAQILLNAHDRRRTSK